MSTRFNIIQYSGKTVMSQHVRQRRDAAAFMLHKECYDMLRGCALLDRPVAWRLLREVDAWEREYKRGSEGKRIFRIDDHDYVYLDWSRTDPIC